MSDENEAALEASNNFVIDGGDQTSEQIEGESQNTESAPVENANESESTEEVTPKVEKLQARFNKITADKHEEIRKRESEAKRADALQAKLDEIENKKPTLTEPTLEGHDYDDVAFNAANVNFQVQEQVKAELASQKAKQEQSNIEAKAQESLGLYNERVTALGKDDFQVKADSIPQLPEGVASAIMSLENGPDMIYHLGSHLDKADSLASMTPMAAMMELGKISSQMSIKPETKTSAAPDPIEPLRTGSVLTKERGPSGATYD